MSGFRIFTDSSCDLPKSFYEEYDVPYICLTYYLEGKSYPDNQSLPSHEFYDKIRNGATPTTSQPSPEVAEEFIRAELEKKPTDILFIAFSSGLSGTYNSVSLAINNIKEDYPDNKFIVIDSLAASAGEGLLVYKAIQYKNEGHTLEETASYIEDLKNHLGHVFTVDDLNCLHRGGRVSKTVAIIGTLANIKPILHVDNEGHLTPLGNVRGRKKSILSLIDAMEKQMGSYRDKNDCIFISNGDCMDDANFAADTIRERFGIEDIRISDVGPVIGSHSGPGTLAIFFLADYK
ncbi:MAG: DegV family protein [Lachnospiraceae bacterium]|nr:DegV family protein [Lachnospiraceae bacterium]